MLKSGKSSYKKTFRKQQGTRVRQVLQVMIILVGLYSKTKFSTQVPWSTVGDQVV